MKDLAVVILNWNGIDFLKKFLSDVVRYSGDAQIVVADNHSNDGSVEFVRSNFPSVQLIQNKSNGGFAKGYNDALKHVDSKYFLLLNSDIEVSENWLVPLYETMKDPSVAGCQPKVISYANRTKFEHAGASGGFIDKNYFPFCRGRLFDFNEEDKGQYDNVVEVFWATGAAMMIRANLFHQVGGFDEDFFAHMEEIDLCWRLKKLNYKFLVVPQSKVYHVGGGTLSYSSPRKTYLNFRNSITMIVKNHEGLIFPMLFKRLCIDGIAASRFLLRGEFSNFWAIFKSHMYQYANLRSILRKRRQIKQSSTQFNDTGLFTANIVWNYYVKGVKTFSSLNQRMFK